MLLSASINVFDGHELLEPLVLTMRPHVEHLSVVYQTMSAWGAPARDDLVPTLVSLHERGWVDRLEHFASTDAGTTATAKQQEAGKRTIGLELARSVGATHFLSMDVDEFYRPDEFVVARRAVEAMRVDAAACRVQDYHARATYRCRDLATYRGMPVHVPFLLAVRPETRYDERSDCFVAVDPARRSPAATSHVFPPAQIVMHHMTTVRGSLESLVSKFANSTSRPPVFLEEPDALARHVWHFDPSLHSAPAVTIVDDEFGVDAALRPRAESAPRALAGPSLAR